MTRNVFDEISIRKLHHILGARFLCFTTDVFSSWSNCVTNFVYALNTTDGKGTFFSPDFNSGNPWVWNLSNNSSVCKPLPFLSGKTLLIILEMSLVWNCFLIGVCNFLWWWLWFLFWSWFLLLPFICNICLDIVLSHLDLQLIDFLLKSFDLSLPLFKFFSTIKHLPFFFSLFFVQSFKSFVIIKMKFFVQFDLIFKFSKSISCHLHRLTLTSSGSYCFASLLACFSSPFSSEFIF